MEFAGIGRKCRRDRTRIGDLAALGPQALAARLALLLGPGP